MTPTFSKNCLMSIPNLQVFSLEKFLTQHKKRLLVTAEGFEKRSLSFVECLEGNNDIFFDCILLDYKYHIESRLTELKQSLGKIVTNEPIVIEYDRFNPSHSEQSLSGLTRSHPNMHCYDEIVIDVSVMSKLLIVILITIFSETKKPIKIIYTEPEEYGPSQEEFNRDKSKSILSFNNPSFGVNQVVRTPKLSSSIMQHYPALLVAFTSFNGQLVRALISDLSPHMLILGISKPPVHEWRTDAAKEIHQDIFDFYFSENDEKSYGDLDNYVCTLDPNSAFKFLCKIYSDFCFFNRIIVSPTGSKMQALGCAVFKLCCPDTHIEYPTPEGYFTERYSSEKIRQIHELELGVISDDIPKLRDAYNLNG